ncbi:MAG: efflux RND transporter periplasmic adaptor subunit [Burkholderiales bacterium]|jgi:membrane fusion protein (multidrug efflux system)|nr:efflux RND transporter periplasmic adaptor subunit [Burkholderiales bacterium]
MARAATLVIAACGLAVALGAAWWLQKPASPSARPVAQLQGAHAPGALQPVDVEVAPVRRMALSDEAQAVGSLRSRRSVVLRPEVSGRVTHIHFSDGARVRKGQVLVQFDDQLLQAQVQQAQAELSIAQANHQRNRELVAQGFVSQRSLDESAASLQVAQAKLALAQAQVARLRIVAPFDGMAGIRNVHVGDYLKDGADIVNIEDIDSMVVDFRLPERYQPQLRAGQAVRVELDALPGRSFEAQVWAIDPQIDANGRSVAVRAGLDNRQGVLRPGMFARVTAVFGAPVQALVVPEEAIVPQGTSPYVFRLEADVSGQGWVARRTSVQLGQRREGVVEVRQGLAAEDQVVTAGQQRLQRDGMPVHRAGPQAQPAAQAASAARAPASSAPAQGR